MDGPRGEAPPTGSRRVAAAVVKSSADPLVARYMAEVNRYPLLSRAQEYDLARNFQATRETKYAHRLLEANLRFVVRIAHEFRGYDVPLLDLVQEGNLGLMMAIKRFDPGRGCRLVSYGVWWIRAYMRAYSMRSWSLVRVGTTQVQRKLFFAVRAARGRVDASGKPGHEVTNIDLARSLKVREGELTNMEVRLAGHDFPLEARTGDGPGPTYVDRLASAAAGPEELVGERETLGLLRRSVRELSTTITAKQRFVLEHRLLGDEGRTLQEVGTCLQVSRERVRQIEGQLLGKLGVSLRKSQVVPTGDGAADKASSPTPARRRAGASRRRPRRLSG